MAADESTSLAVVDVARDGSAAYGFYVAGTADWQWQPADLPDPLPADVVALHLGHWHWRWPRARTCWRPSPGAKRLGG